MTPCFSVNLMSDAFCDQTCDDPGLPCSDPCASLFCYDDPATCTWSGMCDKTCNFCTTLTNSSTVSESTTTYTRTTSTTETTTTESSSTLSSTTESSSTLSSTSTTTK